MFLLLMEEKRMEKEVSEGMKDGGRNEVSEG